MSGEVGSSAAGATRQMAADRAAGGDERLAYRGVFQRILTRPEIGAAIGALAIWVFFWAVAVPFGKASGASSILDVASSPLGIMAVAVAMLMIGGEFDLSSGAATGALAIVTIMLVRDVTGMMPGGGLTLWLALVLSLAAALGLGWFNGTVVNRTGLPSFIVTLGSFFVLVGAKLGFSKLLIGQQQVGKLDDLQALPVYFDDAGELVVFDAENVAELTLDDGTQLVNVPAEVIELIETNIADGLEPLAAVPNLAQLLRPDDVEIFTVPPPTVDLIETNIADGIEPLAGVSDDLINVGDRGYAFMADLFSGEWTRNDHIWNARDWFYTIGIIGGLALCALAIYEMNFRRKRAADSLPTSAILGGILVTLAGWALLRDVSRINDLADGVALDGESFDSAGSLRTIFAWLVAAAGAVLLVGGIGREAARLSEDKRGLGGLAVFLAGIAGSLIGVWRLHATDSVGGNTVASLIIGVGMAAGFLGWGLWRYQARGGLDDALDAMADSAGDLAESGLTRVLIPLGAGLGSLLLSVVIALWMNPDNDFDLWPTTTDKIASVDEAKAAAADAGESLDIITVAGGTVTLLALIMAAAVGLIAVARSARNEPLMAALRSNTLSAVVAGVVAFLATFGFMFLATEQGARAIGFMVFACGGAVGLLVAINRARKHSNALGSTLLMATALAVALMAFFVRSESGTPKFRTQAFSVLLIIAAIMAVWAIATLMFEERNSFDVAADRLGNRMMIAGAAAAAFGLIARLLWVTQVEVDAGASQVKFSVRILWFILFTGICSWVLARTKFGSWTFAVGGNKQAARQVGVPASRTKTQLFMLVSFAAWLVGLLLAFRLNSIQANTGDGSEFEFIIAAVVGGTMLTGGYGSTIGAAIGAFIMAMSVQGIPSARWNSDWRFVFLGVILLLAVIANNFIKAKAEAAR